MTWQRLPSGTKTQEAEFNSFRKKARFLVDESLGDGVARVLRDLGWNTVFGPNVGLARHSDEDVFAYAWRKHRVLLTHDRDFLDDRRFPSHRNPGVVVLPGGSGPARGVEESSAYGALRSTSFPKMVTRAHKMRQAQSRRR